jgi:hypothetical protein
MPILQIKPNKEVQPIHYLHLETDEYLSVVEVTEKNIDELKSDIQESLETLNSLKESYAHNA